jgi:hypothetical protein
MTKANTYFYDTEGNRLGSAEGILPISLRKGMKITIHGYSDTYEVSNWEYHHGQPDEEAGLKIILINKTGRKPLIASV